MPTCGNCGKSVGISDVTCPHCGVLLAAYASPTGSGAAGTYEAPAPPPSAEIPEVDMDVKPPSEKDVVTDPNEVAEEPISTAPQPLFDTYLTVDEIARAAESDHADDVVTITNRKIATKKVEFEVPDYAKPPVNAEPIPTIDDVDDSIPLITHDDEQIKAEPENDDDVTPDPKLASTSGSKRESWLHTAPQSVPVKPVEPQPAPTPKRQRRPKSQPDASTATVGQTDDYLRKLHAEAGYTPDAGAISKPVDDRRISPAERNRNRAKTFSAQLNRKEAPGEQSTKMGCSTLYVLVLAILWFSTVISVMGGHFSPFLIFVTVAATWGFGPVRKFINEMQES